MIQRKIFSKRNKSSKITFFFFTFILFFFIIFFFIILNSTQVFFEIPAFKDSFYVVPDDTGGTKVRNIDKKVLHLNQKQNQIIEIPNDPMLEYSIQIFASNNLDLVKKKLDSIRNNKDSIIKNDKLNRKDLYIVAFDHNLGNEYLLVYKDFLSRKSALDYCLQYLNFLPNCLIVNVQNLD